MQAGYLKFSSIKPILIFTVLFFSGFSCPSQILIKGKIINNNHSRVVLYEPINNFANNLLIERPDFVLYLTPAGYFEKRLQIYLPCVITIRVGQSQPVWLFVAPGDTVSVEINTSAFDNFSPNGGIKIKGKNGTGNEFYNSFNYSPRRKFVVFENMLDSMHFQRTLDFNAVYFALSKIIYPFDSLLVKGKITRLFYDIMVSDTKDVLLTELIKFAFFSNRLNPDDAFALVDSVYSKFPVTEDVIRSGLYGSSIAYYYYYSKAKKYYLNPHLDDSLLIKNGKKCFISSNFVPWLYAPKNIQETEWAMAILQLKHLFSASIGKRDVDAYLNFFPNSKMKDYFSPPYFKLTDESARPNDSAVIIFLKSDSLNSFDSAITLLKGKRILVDLWATWCVPCKMEFSYNDQVDSFCTKNNIQRLYIAFEIGQTKLNLKRDIKAYNLKGFHVVATQRLIDDIVKRFYPGQGGYTIPHYLLVNEQGKVINANATRPSSGDNLFSEMKTAFNLKD
ncbi:MAG: hypothetical protein JST47_03550 [Bacteroidetes bacterium]|nr:hypothetical protein [Bacteroidota bacterium]